MSVTAEVIVSVEEQSEDGELEQSPEKQEGESNDFSLSEDDVETIDDSLDIKPPQAKSSFQVKCRHKMPRAHKKDRDREDRHASHREKHQRDKQTRMVKERDYFREKDRLYREQASFSSTQHYMSERGHRDRRDICDIRSRHSDSRKYDEKTHRELIRDGRYLSERHHHRGDRYDDRDRGDKALQDIRDRLLSKRTTKSEDGASNTRRYAKGESHRHRRHKDADNAENVLQGDSDMYVKEIIDISTGEEEKRKGKEERKGTDEKLTEEDKAEQEMRREKLLEAEREMARVKEQSRLERERRHLEKANKRRFKEELEEQYSKRLRPEDHVVTLSDNSEDEVEEVVVEEVETERSEHSSVSQASKNSRSEGPSERSERSYSRERSRSAELKSSDRSATASPETEEEEEGEREREEKPENESEESPKKIALDEDLPPYYPAVQGCRSVEEFQCLNRIEEGTYGVVYRARDKRTEEIVALKRLKMEKEKEGFPITSLREINTLLKGQHKNIVTVREIVVGSNMDKIFIVMDYVEHDLKSLMETMRHKKQSFTPGEIKCLLHQLLIAVAHLHDNWILHRDLKTSNLLLSHKGILKVGDFGLAREYGSPLKAYTPIVVTLWYRAPELLLCAKEYSTPIDLWSVGCIFAELVLMNALFPGKSEVDQLNRIFKDLGTPNEKIWPGFNKLPAVMKMKFTEYPVSNLHLKFQHLTNLGVELLKKFLTFDPSKRITAEEATNDVYFNEPPLPIDPAMFPTWPAKSELGHKRALVASPKPPSGGGEYKKLRGEDDDGYGFRIGSNLENRRTAGAGFSLKF